MIAVRDHQSALDRADTAFDDARMSVQHKRFNPRIRQERAGPREKNQIVASGKLFHPAFNARFKRNGRGLDRPFERLMLASDYHAVKQGGVTVERWRGVACQSCERR